MDYSFLALLFRQKYIRRWGLMRNVSDESLSSHTAECALITHALCSIGNEVFGRSLDTGAAVLLALYHDAPEVITGDLPTPVKYYDDAIRGSYAKIEQSASSLLLSKLPPQLLPAYEPLFGEGDPELHRMVKIADKLCAYIKCVEEEKSGNMEFRQARQSIRAALDKLSCDELEWFCAYLLPSFSRTLDEM